MARSLRFGKNINRSQTFGPNVINFLVDLGNNNNTSSKFIYSCEYQNTKVVMKLFFDGTKLAIGDWIFSPENHKIGWTLTAAVWRINLDFRRFWGGPFPM